MTTWDGNWEATNATWDGKWEAWDGKWEATDATSDNNVNREAGKNGDPTAYDERWEAGNATYSGENYTIVEKKLIEFVVSLILYFMLN